jgi:hypothetical protein
MDRQETGEGQMVELLASRHPGATESNGYVRVLSDALVGDRTLFAREDYVEEAWRIVDPVVRARTPLHTYEPGSWGPAEAAHIAPPGGWRDPRPVTSSSVAFSSRESTAVGTVRSDAQLSISLMWRALALSCMAHARSATSDTQSATHDQRALSEE